MLYDRLIPPEALDAARPGRADRRRQGRRRAAGAARTVTDALLLEHARGRARGRAAEGRRPVRLRPRRRGGRGAAGGGRRLRGRSGCHRRRRGARATRASRSPIAIAPARSRSSPATRTPSKPRPRIDWPALAAFPGTLVFYMGVRQLPRDLRAARRRTAARPTSPPRSSSAARCPTSACCAAPSGRSASSRPDARRRSRSSARSRRWPTSSRGARPRLLTGAAIAVTRARAQASGLAARPARARRAGRRGAGDPHRAPAGRRSPTSPSTTCSSSPAPNGVQRLFEEVRDARALAGPAIAVIGPGTARRCAPTGSRPTSCPTAPSASRWPRRCASGGYRRALIARARGGPRRRARRAARARRRGRRPRALPHRGRAAGRGRPGRRARRRLGDLHDASSARFLHAAAGTLDGPRLASIGPVTSAALRALGLGARPRGRDSHARRTRRRPRGGRRRA